jgi:16S rRNA (cytidine1402-2'-O)-methyltransferase
VAGRLILCAGPIGNLGDAAPRLGEALREATLIYAEDTRRARILLDHLGVTTPVRSYFVGNEAERAVELQDRLAGGEVIALLTDAGTPGIADPGLTAVRAVAAGAEVTAVPGPSAVTMALAVSGESADRFVFEGFLPRKGEERASRVAAIAAETRTVVFFASPERLVADLADLAGQHPGSRSCVVARELTKLHEECGGGPWWRRRSTGPGATGFGARSPWCSGHGSGRTGPDEAVAAAHHQSPPGWHRRKRSDRWQAEQGIARRALYERVVTTA